MSLKTNRISCSPVINWFYKWLPIIFGCHCREERSFHYKGKKFPICARCTGELIGIIFSLFTYIFFHIGILPSILFMIPLIADGSIQSLTSYESSNIKRLITGLFFGYALANLFIMSSVYAYKSGQSTFIKLME
ncbi:MAG: DUF2085 domain-containing protein [Firmicutes bacterium]|nr:DUF2085 domain-containing protein [Bacillota bacterium]